FPRAPRTRESPDSGRRSGPGVPAAPDKWTAENPPDRHPQPESSPSIAPSISSQSSRPRQLRKAQLGTGRGLAQERRESFEQAGGLARRQHVGFVAEIQTDALPHLAGVERERKLGAHLAGQQRLDLDAVREQRLVVAGAARRHVEHHPDPRHVPRIAAGQQLRGQPFERRLAMAEGAQEAVALPAQKVGEGGIAAASGRPRRTTGVPTTTSVAPVWRCSSALRPASRVTKRVTRWRWASALSASTTDGATASV